MQRVITEFTDKISMLEFKCGIKTEEINRLRSTLNTIQHVIQEQSNRDRRRILRKRDIDASLENFMKRFFSGSVDATIDALDVLPGQSGMVLVCFLFFLILLFVIEVLQHVGLRQHLLSNLISRLIVYPTKWGLLLEIKLLETKQIVNKRVRTEMFSAVSNRPLFFGR